MAIEELVEVFTWRRDVRRFRPDPVDPVTVARLIEVAQLAPSVGYSQPWRFVLIETAAVRAELLANHIAANLEAAQSQGDSYRQLKLSGLDQAPVQIAVFCDLSTATGRGLGKQTMPETLQYSVVMAIHTLWLAATALGLGVGWVSILDPESATRTLDVPEEWELTALLCIGYPERPSTTPELLRLGWERPDPRAATPLKR